VIEPPLEEVFKRLVLDEGKWRFYAPPGQDERADDLGPEAVALPLIPSGRPLATELPDRAPDELRCAGTDFTRLRRAIRSIHRRSRTELEERGVRILYVTLGMLEWREQAGTDSSRSPILLVPAAIERDSARDPFKLSFVDEEVVLNPALEVKLQKDFGFQLPPLPEDWEQATVQQYLAQIAEAVHPLLWTVHEECWIATLSFFKLVMYQDLNRHSELVRKHPVVCALAGEGSVIHDNGAVLPNPQQLDEAIRPADSFLVMDADSSQLACVEAVKRGVSLVLQGPPGTGKTQTITNIIAECLAAGRKVLFVSEKMAALEQVYERLQRQALDPYCLELHSHKANKREVAKELERCLRTTLQPRSVMTQFELEQLRDRREQLNRYVIELHAIRQPLGRSVYSVLGELSRLDEVPFVSAETPDSAAVSLTALDRAVQLAERLSRLWKIVVEGDQFPWRGCAVRLYGVQVRAEVREMLASCRAAVEALRKTGSALAQALQLSLPLTPDDAMHVLRVGQLLARGPGVEGSWLLRADVDFLMSTAQRLQQLAADCRARKSEIARHYEAGYFDLAADSCQRLATVLDAVAARGLAATASEDGGLIAQRREILQVILDLPNAIDLWRRDAVAVAEELGLPRARSFADIRRLLRVGELCQVADRPARSWLAPIHIERIAEMLRQLKADRDTWSLKRRELFQVYNASFLDLDLEELADRYSTRYQSLYRWFRPGFYRLRRTLRRSHREHKHAEDVFRFLQLGRDIQRLQKKCDEDSAGVGALLGDWYKGYETDFRCVEAAAQTVKELIFCVGSPVPEALASIACIGGALPADLITRLERLRAGVSSWEQRLTSTSRLLSDNVLPVGGLPFALTDLDQVRDWAKGLREPLSEAVRLLDPVAVNMRPGINRTVQEVLSDLDELNRVKALESDLVKDSTKLRDDFGYWFRDLDTDWDAIASALAWVQQLRVLLGEHQLPAATHDVAIQGGSVAPDARPLGQAARQFDEAFERLAERFGGTESDRVLV